MKKLYLFLFIAMAWLCLSVSVQAQPFTGGVFSTIPGGGPLSVAATWVGGIQPPDNCNNCQILIFGNSTVDMAGIFLTNHCQVIVESNAILTINQRVDIRDSSEIQIGTNGSIPASVVMNAEGDLDTTSTVRLASNNAFIDASSAMTSASDSIDLISGDGGGLYYITGPTTFSELVDNIGYGNASLPPDAGHPLGFFFAMYTINCGGANPNPCAGGFVFGPAISGFNATDSIYEFGVTTILPVELLSFTAILNNNLGVDVSWATGQEINSNYYSVQRSLDGTNFQEIGRVEAKGFSSITSDYSFTDPGPLHGKAYYRLQMVDLDGKFKYSKVVTVSSSDVGPPILVFNNPFTDEIRLQINSTLQDQISMELSDMQGKILIKKQVRVQPGGSLVNIQPGNSIAPGLYLLNIQSHTISRTIKLIKQ